MVVPLQVDMAAATPALIRHLMSLFRLSAAVAQIARS
jgi:hypothetical protein